MTTAALSPQFHSEEPNVQKSIPLQAEPTESVEEIPMVFGGSDDGPSDTWDPDWIN